MNYNKLQNLIGIPWIYKESDCWAIFKRGLKDIFDVEVSDLILPNKSSVNANIAIFEHELNPPKWIRIEKQKPGCAAVFYDYANRPVHVGLMIDNISVLHSMGAPGMNTSSRLDKINVILKHRLYSKCEFYDYGI